jgi:HrpA-like RNA helicase
VLVFLPGQEDIESLHNLLEDNLKTLLPSVTHHVKDEATRDKTSRADCSYEIFPLYASLSPEKQLQAFSPSKPNVRKYVLATNIAETSVTISGIKYGEYLQQSRSFHCPF